MPSWVQRQSWARLRSMTYWLRWVFQWTEGPQKELASGRCQSVKAGRWRRGVRRRRARSSRFGKISRLCRRPIFIGGAHAGDADALLIERAGIGSEEEIDDSPLGSTRALKSPLPPAK